MVFTISKESASKEAIDRSIASFGGEEKRCTILRRPPPRRYRSVGHEQPEFLALTCLVTLGGGCCDNGVWLGEP